MFKERLLTPGPTQIPLRILQAMERPLLHHRSEVFRRELLEAAKGMQWLCNWDSHPIFLACSGTGAMEAALLNSCNPGDEIITVSGGSFGARWKMIGERLGLLVHEIAVEWGQPVSVEMITSTLARYPATRALCIQHSETSTTVLHPLEHILPAVKEAKPEILTIVDGISSCATTPMPGSPATIDMYIAGSQKAFMLPPGLSMIMVSAKGWSAIESTSSRSLYFDLARERASQALGETCWTPASTLITGLNAALEMMRDEGLECIYARHQLMALVARRGAQALGCRLVAPSSLSTSVTGIYPPGDLDADTLRSKVLKLFGMRLAGGQGSFKGKIIRIGHMGFVDPFDIMNAITAIGITAKSLRAPVDTDAAARVCLQSIIESYDRS